RLLNWEKIDIDVKNLKAVFLTHSHMDHCGYLPLLVRQGFKGTIYCTPPTEEIARIVLLDSAKIQMEEAEYANKKKFSKHQPAKPLYDLEDVEKTLPLFRAVNFNQKYNFHGFEVEFKSSGHILGAASVYLTKNGRRLLFSGDLGQYHDALMQPPDDPLAADVVVMESTYGDRLHSIVRSSDLLQKMINETWQKKGILLIPAFALGRSQNLIHEIQLLKKQGLIPREIPVYFNSPMGSQICELYSKYQDYQKLRAKDFAADLEQVRFIASAEESQQLNETKDPAIIIAASGMLEGGRVLHHIKAFGGNPNNTILLAGYQALGTRGWSLAHGQNKIKIHGNFVDILAQIVTSDSFSAHADQQELLRWIGAIPAKPQKIFIVHGEPIASDELRKLVEEKLQTSVTVPLLNSVHEV
ncbi:MAG TPA: MBL fold metallo-hydrolase, partial [Bdellovibrio sp.]|nr:MBL fold metallo-hydrolase [Bdellovibrio sp.]